MTTTSAWATSAGLNGAFIDSRPPVSPPPTGEKGIWFPLADAGALKIYLDKLNGKCLEDNVIIDRGNEYLGKR